MAVNLSPAGGVAAQFFTNTGSVLTGGKLYTYAAGTTTPAVTYTSSNGATPWTNPIVLDAAGRVPSSGEIWLTAGASYKFLLKDSNDVLIATYDNITGINGTGITSNAVSVTYDPSGTGAVSTTVQTKLREYVSVFDFMTAAQIADVQSNAQSVNITAAVQSAITFAYTNGKDLYYPQGTYKLASALTWNGCNMYGDGEGNTIINGAADCDVFFTPDYSISQSGSVSAPRLNAHVSDMTISVNNSGTQTYPNGTFNRPIYPVVAAWSATLSVSIGTYYSVAGVGIYKCIASGITASTAPSVTVGKQTDGTATWLYIDSQQRYVGNAAFAAPVYNGAAASSNFLHCVFKNLFIAASGSSSNLATACIYSQIPFYDCTFENQIWRFTAYGYLNVPPTTNFASVEFAPDASMFNKVAIYCAYPFVSYNSTYSTMLNMQCYSTTVGWRSAYLLSYKSLFRSECASWNLVNFYCESNSSTTGAIGFIDGNSHFISGGTLKSAYGQAYYVFAGNGSTIQSNFIGNDGTFSVINLVGNFNTFTATHTGQVSLSNLVVDNGLANLCQFSFADSSSVESERQLTANPGTARNPYGIRQNDWLVKNCATTPFYDMLFGGREFVTHNTTSLNVTDTTLETGGYVRSQDGLGWYSSTANRQSMAIGSRIPAGKVQFLLKGRLSLTTTASISLTAVPLSGSNVNLGSITPTWSTFWQVFEFDVDLSSYSGYTLQFNINNPASTSTYLDVAWVAIVPFAPANTIVKNQFFSGIVDLEGTGTPENAVTANIGSTYRRIDGGAGTSFYVKQSGTGNTGWVGK